MTVLKMPKKKLTGAKKGVLFSAQETAHLDTNAAIESRRALSGEVEVLCDQIQQKLNRMLPFPYNVLIEKNVERSTKHVEVYQITVQSITSRFHIWSYLFLRSIPILGRFVSGPKVISKLRKSDYAEKREARIRGGAVSAMGGVQ